MEFLMLLWGSVAVKQVLLAALVKWLADIIKKLFEDVDENGILQGYKAYIQVMVLVASTLVSLGNLALTGQLNTVDVKTISYVLASIVSLFVGSQGIHACLQSTFVHLYGRKTLR